MQQVSKQEFADRLANVRAGNDLNNASRTSSSYTAAGEGPLSGTLGGGGSSTASLRASKAQDPFAWKSTTIQEQRGPTGVSNVKPAKNVAVVASQLSLPIATGPNRPDKVARVECDVVKHCQHAVTLTGKTIFTKDQCKTVKGWTGGKI
ncbi:Hypothetical protein, putative [Bodo saltans]|uniref:Uncharacterized protein n=1 Tax=Bodo saltans TaxID=75058 RepID=A0A0S4J9D6_BODSA|nr:Hypothetical protein, putative [Bodo saltans]|eukprot:CUG86524.1 Hypothetical protein, putative [Bodo saltans]